MANDPARVLGYSHPMRMFIWMVITCVVAGCANPHAGRLLDSTDTVLAAPLDQVKAALIEILSTDGYPVRDADDDRIIITGYRRETEGPWDGLLTSRFGVGRSNVEATVSPESGDTTRLTISVLYESKNHFWSAWRETTPPPHRNATLYLRAVRKSLGLL